MSSFIDEFRKFVFEGVRDNAFYRSLAYGIVFSLIITFIIGLLEGTFSLSVSPFKFSVATPQHWIALIFASFSFLFAIFGYSSDIHSREDILTPLRKKLVGYWQVRTQSWKIEDNKIELSNNTTFCTISIEDIGRKLIMHFEIIDSDIFSNQKLDVTSITLGYRSEPKQLIYFHDLDLRLRAPIGQGADKITQINFPFLGILNIDLNNNEVNDMSGYWYDIDNTIFNLARRLPNLAGLQELSNAVEGGLLTFKGTLQFHRLPRASGGNA